MEWLSRPRSPQVAFQRTPPTAPKQVATALCPDDQCSWCGEVLPEKGLRIWLNGKFYHVACFGRRKWYFQGIGI